jgi:hypothetical protein
MLAEMSQRGKLLQFRLIQAFRAGDEGFYRAGEKISTARF